MQINYIISPYPTLLLNMIAKAYEAQAPTAEVASITLPAPHLSPATVNFTGLDRIPHIVRLFTSSGTLLHDFVAQPTENIVTVFTPIFFKIGDGNPDTPLSGSSQYVNTALAGKNNTQVKVFANGSLRYPGVHYDTDITGGFHLLQVGDIFEDQTEWMVEQIPDVVATPVNDSVVAKILGGFIDVQNVTRNYSAGDLRKLIRLSGATGIYNFNAGVPVPIGYSHKFVNNLPYNVITDTPVINFINAPLIYNNTSLGFFPLPPGNMAEFTFDGTNWNLTMDCRVAPSSGQAFAKCIFAGSYYIGNLVGINDLRTVLFTDLGTNQYKVLGSLRALSPNPDNDNDCTFTIGIIQSNSFNLSLREFTPNSQNLMFDYFLMLIV